MEKASLIRPPENERALSQFDVARRFGRPQFYVSKYERGVRCLDLPELVEICYVLKISAESFARDLQRELAAAVMPDDSER